MVKVLGAFGTLAGVLAFAIVQVVNAVKQPSVADAQLRELVSEKERRERGKALDDKAAALATEERQRELNKIRSDLRDLDLRYPELKIDPLRSPR
jgi:hypothetical protein